MLIYDAIVLYKLSKPLDATHNYEPIGRTVFELWKSENSDGILDTTVLICIDFPVFPLNAFAIFVGR